MSSWAIYRRRPDSLIPSSFPTFATDAPGCPARIDRPTPQLGPGLGRAPTDSSPAATTATAQGFGLPGQAPADARRPSGQHSGVIPSVD